MNKKIPFKSKAHKKILEALRIRLSAWEKENNKGKANWEQNEEEFRAYMPERDHDAQRRLNRDNTGKPEYTTLVVPHSYAVAMTAHTYLSTVFLGRSPVWQFQGRHGEPEMQIQAIEAMMDYQMSGGKMLVPLYIWLLDCLKYGVGVIAHSWDRKVIHTTEIVEEEEIYLGVIKTGRMKKVKRRREGLGYEGNTIANVRPDLFIWDPRYPMTEFQTGEFAGSCFSLGWHEIHEKEASGAFMNVDVLKRTKGGESDYIEDYAPANVDYPESTDFDTMQIPDYGKREFQRMYVKLVPAQWGLDTSENQQIWVFTLCDKRVIVEARPYGALHGMFPYSILETEMDSYALFKRSMVELNKPMQDTMTWLINTHFYNVRSVLNDQLLVDPSLVYMSDLKNPGPGRHIRLRPKAFAKGVMRDAVQQLPIGTVTNQHLSDTQLVNELSQRIHGVSDNLMGLVNAGGRKTATEVRGTNTYSTNRLKTVAEYMSAIGFAPAGQLMLQQSQQWMSMDRKLRIAGDLIDPTSMESYVNVTPEAIQGFYDFIPVDGTMPIDRFAQVNLWREILMGISQMPAISMQYDLGRIFAWMAQIGGLKNINRFKIEVMGPAQLAQAADSGNIVPIGGGGAGGTGTEGSFGRPGEPGQLSGLGATA